MKYPVILADCPWHFRVWSKATGSGRSAESHYPTMELDELCALPAPKLMEKDCAMFMWTTWPTLLEAVSVGSAWGLEYKTCAFLWAKQNAKSDGFFTGMGYYTRANTEPCLLFTRGSPKRIAKDVPQLVVAQRREHSRKPDEVYERIERLMAGPYLELFGRSPRDGWDVLGNAIDGMDIRDAIERLATIPNS